LQLAFYYIAAKPTKLPGLLTDHMPNIVEGIKECSKSIQELSKVKDEVIKKNEKLPKNLVAKESFLTKKEGALVLAVNINYKREAELKANISQDTS
jgi:hypothetical protein